MAIRLMITFWLNMGDMQSEWQSARGRQLGYRHTSMETVVSDEPVLAISEDAIAKIQEIRDAETSDEPLGLYLEITGVRGPQFVYELSFAPVSDAKPADAVHTYNDDLAVIIAAKDAEKFEGATLTMGSDPANPSLSINNPNVPATPVMASTVPVGDLTGPLAEQIQTLLDSNINPSIAGHGGAAQLISVDGGTAYLQLSGGCQGCGMASVTLKQGIERILMDNIPELEEVVDVTDHASGDDPYYEAAKK